MSYSIVPISRELFVASLTGLKEDRFAPTFRAKCDMMDAWEKCQGIIVEGKVAAAIVTTYSKRLPKTANLQLLHTFSAHRKKGMGKLLCQESVFSAAYHGCQYFRVSAEPDAVEFYKTVGFKFIGKQKSGCQLSMFPITGSKVENNRMIPDSVVWGAVYSKRKGGCVEVFDDYTS